MRRKPSVRVNLLLGAGLLLASVARPASAGILYTPLDLSFHNGVGGGHGFKGVVLFDDTPWPSWFEFQPYGFCASIGGLLVECVGGFWVSSSQNALHFMVNPHAFFGPDVRALEAGTLIGPGLPSDQWGQWGTLAETRIWVPGQLAGEGEIDYGGSEYGEWINVTDRYLGFRAIRTIDDEFGNTIESHTHYGWARLTVLLGSRNFALGEYPIHVTVSGVAVNMAPDEPILAGQAGVPEPSTWVMLALGLAAIASGRLRRGKRRAKGPAPA